MDWLGWMRRPDLRAPVTRKQLEEFYAGEPFEYFTLPLQDNPALKGLGEWYAPEYKNFKRMNKFQQTLQFVSLGDGDISNGGLGQLVFNSPLILVDIVESFERVGCVEIAKQLDRILENLSNDEFVDDLKEAKDEFAGIGDDETKKEAWDAFKDFSNAYGDNTIVYAVF